MKWQPGFSRIFAAALVSVAVLLGGMIAAGPTDAAPNAAAPNAAPPELDWLTIEAEPAEPTPPPIAKPTDAEPTAKPESPPLESFRPEPPNATPRELAAKIEALEVRVSKLEESRPRAAPAPTPPPMVATSSVSAPRTVCTNGVCRIMPQQPTRAVAPRGWRLFRR